MAKKLTKRASKALDASIEHHKENLKAKLHAEVKLGPDECALCVEFYDDTCDRCPIKNAGFRGCEGTPYGDVNDRYMNWRFADWNGKSPDTLLAARRKFRKAEHREIKFLESLKDSA